MINRNGFSQLPTLVIMKINSRGREGQTDQHYWYSEFNEQGIRTEKSSELKDALTSFKTNSVFILHRVSYWFRACVSIFGICTNSLHEG